MTTQVVNNPVNNKLNVLESSDDFDTNQSTTSDNIGSYSTAQSSDNDSHGTHESSDQQNISNNSKQLTEVENERKASHSQTLDKKLSKFSKIQLFTFWSKARKEIKDLEIGLKSVELKNESMFVSWSEVNEENEALNKANEILKESYDLLSKHNEQHICTIDSLTKSVTDLKEDIHKMECETIHEELQAEIYLKLNEKYHEKEKEWNRMKQNSDHNFKNITIFNHKLKIENKSLKDRMEILNNKLHGMEVNQQKLMKLNCNEKDINENLEKEIIRIRATIQHLNTNVELLTKENAEHIWKSEKDIIDVQAFHDRKYLKVCDSYHALQNRIHRNHSSMQNVLHNIMKPEVMRMKKRNKRSEVQISCDYLRNIFVKFLILSEQFTEEQIALVPVLASILKFTKRDKRRIDAAYNTNYISSLFFTHSVTNNTLFPNKAMAVAK